MYLATILPLEVFADDNFLLQIPSIIVKAKPNTDQFSINTSVVKFTASTKEQELIDRNAATITVGGQRLYIGTNQVSSINQNPIIKSFGGGQNWVRTDYEQTGADGRGVSLFFAGSRLYASFTVDGTQGSAQQDFRRVSQDAEQSWLRSYGAGGGPKASVIAELDLATGQMLSAAYLTAVLSSGKSNSLLIEKISTTQDKQLTIDAKSFFAPRASNGQALPRTTQNPSPFNYRVQLSDDLRRVLFAGSDDY